MIKVLSKIARNWQSFCCWNMLKFWWKSHKQLFFWICYWRKPKFDQFWKPETGYFLNEILRNRSLWRSPLMEWWRFLRFNCFFSLTASIRSKVKWSLKLHMYLRIIGLFFFRGRFPACNRIIHKPSKIQIWHNYKMRENVTNTVTKKKLGLKQFPWIKTIFMFLDPN